jgi:hypothetical protein
MKIADIKQAEEIIFAHLEIIKTKWNEIHGLHWPDLDEDLSVTGIIEGRFGVMS